MNAKSGKFWEFWKTEQGQQVIGLILGIIGCCLCWGKHYYSTFETRGFFLTQLILGEKEIRHIVCGNPTFGSGTLGLIMIFLLYVRGILQFNKGSKLFGLFRLLVLITIFATFFSLIIYQTKEYDSWLTGFSEQIKNDLLLFAVMIVTITTLLFGMKGISKFILLACALIVMIDRWKVLDESLGIQGFLAFLLFVSCFYLQQNVNIQELKTDLRLLYNKSSNVISDTFDEASNEAQRLGQVAASAASAYMGVPNPMNAHKKKKHNSSAPEQSVDSDDGNLSFFKNHSSCLFSTAVGCIGDGKPVEYLYRFEKFWIFVEDSPEVSSISTNPNVSMIISDKGKEVKVDGTAEIVKPEMPEYNFYLRYKQIPLETIKALPVNMQLIKVSTTNVSVE